MVFILKKQNNTKVSVRVYVANEKARVRSRGLKGKSLS